MNLGMGPDSSATPTTQCRSKSVSAKSLPKTGISGNLAGDFGRILSKVVAIRSLETEREARESPYFAGFPRLWCNLSQVDGLAGSAQGSNFHIPLLKNPFELSREFRAFSRYLALETFAASSCRFQIRIRS